MVKATTDLLAEYEKLFADCKVNAERTKAVDDLVTSIIANKTRYEAVGTPLSIPWHFIAVIHNMESSQSFTKHLHNGDPLTARTVHVPSGRPASGKPPFTWEASATDALSMRNVGAKTDWTIGGTLYQLEAYNGWGYRVYHSAVLSPYLWSFSNHYTKGKYTSDGKWSKTAVSDQCGAAVLLRAMADKGHITMAGATASASPINTAPSSGAQAPLFLHIDSGNACYPPSYFAPWILPYFLGNRSNVRSVGVETSVGDKTPWVSPPPKSSKL